MRAEIESTWPAGFIGRVFIAPRVRTKIEPAGLPNVRYKDTATREIAKHTARIERAAEKKEAE